MLVESADNRAGAGMAHDDAAPWQQQRLRQILFDGNIAIPSATGKNSLAQSTSRNRRRPAQGCRWYSGYARPDKRSSMDQDPIGAPPKPIWLPSASRKVALRTPLS